MRKVVISDTSTLILFHKINELNLLQKVYGELITTSEVAKEFGENLPITNLLTSDTPNLVTF